MEVESKIEEMINVTLGMCKSWLSQSPSGAIEFLDPVDGREIHAHYGTSHFAAAQLIISVLHKDDESYSCAVKLLLHVLDNWSEATRQQDFHFDFNNFALCIADEVIRSKDKALSERIRSTVLATCDSNHNTVNWLPMRIFVNNQRYKWTKDAKYNTAMNSCMNLLNSAINDDGGVEDRLPKGKSYNLQYNISTVALMCFLRVNGIELDISKQLGFLLDKVLPDGDVNYQGRGTNQIFAWGMWVYLLAATGQVEELAKAIDFLAPKLKTTLDNNNLLLNAYQGTEKYLWWDYHYSSVYTAHFLLWVCLALKDYKSQQVTPYLSKNSDTGLFIKNASQYKVAIFSGRDDYLAERGPIINALWLHNKGVVSKSSLAPWLGQFGNKYMRPEVAIHNYFGLLEIRQNTDFSNHSNRFLRKFSTQFPPSSSLQLKPMFSDFEIVAEHSDFEVVFKNVSNQRVMLNLPFFQGALSSEEISLTADGDHVPLECNLKLRNQYDWCDIYQSSVSDAKEWRLHIKG